MAILAKPQMGRMFTILARVAVCVELFLCNQICAFPKEMPKDQPSPNTGIISNNQPDKRKFFLNLASQEAKKNHLPLDIADAVMAIESGYDPNAVGTVGEIGLMQVRPETATMLGFNGQIEDLAKPETNIHYGVKYLSEAWRLANGDLCRALMKYRAGHGEESMSPLSADYCTRARIHLAAIGSPFAAGTTQMTADLNGTERDFGVKTFRTFGPRIRTVATSRAFWAAEERRVKAITARIERKWHRLAAR